MTYFSRVTLRITTPHCDVFPVLPDILDIPQRAAMNLLNAVPWGSPTCTQEPVLVHFENA
jgi:hypothetical protein